MPWSPLGQGFLTGKVDSTVTFDSTSIAGSKADTLYYSQDAYEKAREPKELFVIPAASHIDLYDKPQYVTPAVVKLKEFFGKSLP